jgi:hypothetical protein
MIKKPEARRILALNPRSRRCGFAVIEGSCLLEWGIKEYRVRSNKLIPEVRKRVQPLFLRFVPSVVVVKELTASQKGSRIETVISVFRQQTAEQLIEIVVLRAWEIQNLFSQPGRHTRHAVAARIALLYPELTWKLPSTRKAWESEPYNLAIFDALALALAYRARSGNILPLPRRPEKR